MYRAELLLEGRIATELCHWQVKSNEPVLTLVKQEQGHWERLVRIKVAVQLQQLLFDCLFQIMSANNSNDAFAEYFCQLQHGSF